MDSNNEFFQHFAEQPSISTRDDDRGDLHGLCEARLKKLKACPQV